MQNEKEKRVLVLAPTAKDARITGSVLQRAGIAVMLCPTISDLNREIKAGAGALLLTDESLKPRGALESLSIILAQQPEWSDLPVVLLSGVGAGSPLILSALRSFHNVLLLERPVRVPTLLNATTTVLRGRERQYRIRDLILELHERQEELAAAKESADQANRAKDHFLAILSHELRTPLTPVVMGMSMLQRRTDIDPVMREMLEVMSRNVEMEARLIDDLLDVTRIARGKIELTRTPVDLHKVLQRAVEVCKPEIEARKLQFSMDIDNKEYWVKADAPRLQQVFWNLLKNAIKFTPDGGCISISARQVDGIVSVEVKDNGIGIDKGQLKVIFNAFEQAERSHSRLFGGLGLGLAISKALVEMHAGTLSAHSEGQGKGATFFVTLPLGEAVQKMEIEREQNARYSLSPLRILLVEDHGISARMIQQVLIAEGHQVEIARAMEDALQVAKTHVFDLMISDLGLPDGSGYELLRELRRRGFEFPSIALSGYGQQDDIRQSYDAGFIAHLIKPASREKLLDAIAAATSTAVQ